MRRHNLRVQLWLMLFISINSFGMHEQQTNPSEYDSNWVEIETFRTIDTSRFKGIAPFDLPKSWRVGQLHSFFLLAWALGEKIDFEMLNVANTNGFREYAPPHTLANFLNKQLTDAKVYLEVTQEDKMTKEELACHIFQSINMGAPLTAYSTTNDNLNLITIFAYRVDNKIIDLIVSTGNAQEHELHVISLDNLYRLINLSSWIQEIEQNLDELENRKPYSKALPLARAFFEQIKPFTLLQFKAHDAKTTLSNDYESYCWLYMY